MENNSDFQLFVESVINQLDSQEVEESEYIT